MDKWLPVAVILLIIICILEPWILFGIFCLFLLIVAFDLWYWYRLPPPYMSLDSELHIRMNWLTRANQKSVIEIWERTEKKPKITQFFSPQITQNEYTEKYMVASIVLNTLTLGHQYNYMIWQETTKGKKRKLFSGKDLWFTVPIKGFKSESLRIAVLGDLQPVKYTPPLIQMWILRQVRKAKPDLLINLGDHTMEGVQSKLWRWYLHLIGPIAKHTPVVGVPGNHDLKLNRKGGPVVGQDAYNTYINYPNTKGPYGIHFYGVHILALYFHTSNTLDSDQGSFVKTELTQHQAPEWLITLWHSSPYNSLAEEPNVKDLRNELVPIIREAGGRLWLGGHEHSYQHYTVDGVEFITAAATSSFHHSRKNLEHMVKIIYKFHHCIIDFTQTEMLLRAITTSGKIIDEFQQKKE